MKTANFFAAIMLAGLAGSVQAAAPAQEGKTDKGEALVDASGKALYTYDKDAEGKSNCNDKCAQNWPPLAAKADAKAEGDWTIVKRDDGSSQWAYKGKPLYTWMKDEKSGVAGGDGVGGVWHLATP
jgi:predicted lipoprotein with Yx(FWY)xxD motif